MYKELCINNSRKIFIAKFLPLFIESNSYKMQPVYFRKCTNIGVMFAHNFVSFTPQVNERLKS
jgi:hypothetical protein